MYCLVFASIITALLYGCSDKQSPHISETRLLLDTYCTIIIHGDVDSELLDEAFSLCAELETLFSITIEGSDVWRINHTEGDFVTVDSRTAEVIKAGLEFGELSGGMFDIALGRLTRLWDFSSGESNIPSAADIEAAIQSVEFAEIYIDGDNIKLTKPSGESLYARIDLGAIAKGYIADMIAVFLIEKGVSGALIDLGGDVVTVGNRSNGSPWRIALREPFGGMEDWIGIVEIAGLSGLAVVSSGIYERSFEKDGILYHHILDPYTGMPVITDVVSATVIANSAKTGEGLSTIAILVGSEKALEILEKVYGFIGAVLVLENGDLLKFGEVDFIYLND